MTCLALIPIYSCGIVTSVNHSETHTSRTWQLMDLHERKGIERSVPEAFVPRPKNPAMHCVRCGWGLCLAGDPRDFWLRTFELSSVKCNRKMLKVKVITKSYVLRLHRASFEFALFKLNISKLKWMAMQGMDCIQLIKVREFVQKIDIRTNVQPSRKCWQIHNSWTARVCVLPSSNEEKPLYTVACIFLSLSVTSYPVEHSVTCRKGRISNQYFTPVFIRS